MSQCAKLLLLSYSIPKARVTTGESLAPAYTSRAVVYGEQKTDQNIQNIVRYLQYFWHAMIGSEVQNSWALEKFQRWDFLLYMNFIPQVDSAISISGLKWTTFSTFLGTTDEVVPNSCVIADWCVGRSLGNNRDKDFEKSYFLPTRTLQSTPSLHPWPPPSKARKN